MEKQQLEQFIKTKVTAATFDLLPEKLDISQHKFTRIMNKPQEATLDQVLNLSALLRVPPCQLIDKFQMGYQNITLDEYTHYKELGKAA